MAGVWPAMSQFKTNGSLHTASCCTKAAIFQAKVAAKCGGPLFNRKRIQWLEHEVSRLTGIAEDRKQQLLEAKSAQNFLQDALDDASDRLKDLLDRFMALNERAFQIFKAEKRMETPPPAPVFMDPLGKIQSMEAMTKEELQQKADAESEIRAVLGH